MTFDGIQPDKVPSDVQQFVRLRAAYSVILDTSIHVYLYRQPRPMERAELGNRKSGQKVGGESGSPASHHRSDCGGGGVTVYAF